MRFRQAVWDEPLLIELSREGRVGFSLQEKSPSVFQLAQKARDQLPSTMLRTVPPDLPEISEPEIIRHYLRLSQKNFAIDLGIYPLGSCTMKYNPKVSQRIARDPRIANLHPYQDPNSIQGILEILWELENYLREITGMAGFSLAPAAGAQGEYVGALIFRKYLDDQGLPEKDEMLVPDSAHGTNPASAAMAGFKVVKIPSSQDGIVTAEAVKKVISKKTAGMMLTVPNTLGIFEGEIEEVAAIVHECKGLLYYDGANMNALLGRVRPGDMSFDVVHVNVHKTFATPHGGGGPGAGPVGVVSELLDYLPIPRITRENTGEYRLNYDSKKSIGMIKSFYGNIGVLLRAYCYILTMGGEGLKEASEQAVLASNYLLSLIDRSAYSLPYSPQAPRKHEFVVSASPLKRATGISASDVAKAILDSGQHAPTTYFPLIVPEALMIEPTETEPLENLKEYASVLNEVAKTSRSDKDRILSAPTNTSIGRLDEFRASHPSTMTLNWKKLRQGKKP